MESKDKHVELIDEAIKRMLDEERKNKEPSAGDGFSQGGGDDKDEDRRLINRLLSQLESLKGDNEALQHQPESLTKLEEGTSSEDGEGMNERGGKQGGDHGDVEKIVKELNKIKKQNTITHWLLSIMIVLTVAWQASEVTILFRIKDGLRNPFQWIGSMLTGIRKDEEQQSESPAALPSLKMPEFPQMEMLDLGLTSPSEKH